MIICDSDGDDYNISLQIPSSKLKYGSSIAIPVLTTQLMFVFFFSVSINPNNSEVSITRLGNVFPMSGYMEFRVAETICEELGFL